LTYDRALGIFFLNNNSVKGNGMKTPIAFFALFSLLACGVPQDQNGENPGAPPGSGPPDETVAEEGNPIGSVTDEQSALFVEGYTLSSGQLVESIQVSGTIRGVREATITSETQGRIIQDNVVLGQVVSQDTVLVAVDSEIAQISLNQAESQYANARLDYQSAQTLFNSGSISRADLNRSQASLNGALAAYQRALKAFEDTRIRAPFAGYISQKDPGIGEGNYLSPGRPVARVVDLSTLKMILSVGESDVSFLEPGYPAQVVVPSIKKTFQGSVTEVAAGSDPSTGSFQFNVEFANPETNGIRSGLSARAIIQVNGQKQQLILPSFAQIGRGEGAFVYRLEDGRAVKTPIRVLSKRANRMVVESDLGPGDVVITSGLTSLGDGRRVEVTVLGESGELQ
jgi:membrane fusion protein (multidrug efflux system)